jgi:glycosyltransferase involved in cell wall biosynthesis
MVARFDPMKDQANFLKAATTMAEGADDVHFVLVGRGMVPENEQLKPHMGDGLSGRIHLLGIRDDIPRILAGLDLAVSSSLFGEGFSNTIGEAMSCGVPCVVTDVGDSPQIVGDTGKVVPPGNAGELSQAMSRIYHMAHPERERLGELARRRIMDNYALGDVVRRFEDFYEQMDQGFSPNAAHHHPSYNRV